MEYTQEKQIMALNAYYTNPSNLVDLFGHSAAKWGENKLFGTKKPAADTYEWVTYRQVAERVNNLRGAAMRSRRSTFSLKRTSRSKTAGSPRP
jgi:hypothetical protein